MAYFLCNTHRQIQTIMEMISIKSKKELDIQLEKGKKVWCLLYKKSSVQSDCALNNLSEAIKGIENTSIFVADVRVAKDIHPNYDIKSVPTLMEFNEAKELKNVIKGCQTSDFYKNLIEESLFRAEMKAEGKPQKRVTVYSTPTCSWCNTLKTHLRTNRIMYNDIDISQNEEAAKAMVARSGQQGVPQTDINGEMIVGFDKKRINELLNIK